MFGKKLLATVLSLGILSVCSMGALAGTISGSGYSSGDPEQRFGAVPINFSITTQYNSGSAPTVISRMEFPNICSAPVNCYIETTVFQTDPANPQFGGQGGDTNYTHDYMMQCVLSVTAITPPAIDHITSIFHYSSSYYGSFTGGLIKYGFDS